MNIKVFKFILTVSKLLHTHTRAHTHAHAWIVKKSYWAKHQLSMLPHTPTLQVITLRTSILIIIVVLVILRAVLGKNLYSDSDTKWLLNTFARVPPAALTIVGT